MSQEWEHSSIQVGRTTQKWDKNGKNVESKWEKQTPKWDKHGNKAGKNGNKGEEETKMGQESNKITVERKEAQVGSAGKKPTGDGKKIPKKKSGTRTPK